MYSDTARPSNGISSYREAVSLGKKFAKSMGYEKIDIAKGNHFEYKKTTYRCKYDIRCLLRKWWDFCIENNIYNK